MASSFRLKVDYTRHRLNFRFDAGTSRGVLKTKDTYFVRASSEQFPGVEGYGEAGPLPKLSIDDVPDFEEKLGEICREISEVPVPPSEQAILDLVGPRVPEGFPSIRFALETALLDLLNGGKKKILSNDFYDSCQAIAINGLVWMGDHDFMLEQIRQKLQQGYNCIKMKIGSIDFEQECELLAFIREQYSSEKITLRVDANGAFSKEEALSKLQRLAAYDLHSIEQPIKQGQWNAMKTLAKDTPVPIALDEELIGVSRPEKKEKLLDEIQPQYIILKPTLLGGIQATREWIDVAEERGIGWWMTSALESNIGLNAVAQLTSTYQPLIPQGLGTGQLYHNNITSPLHVDRGEIIYDANRPWEEMGKLFK
jgi:o-succinylbenzoate synthase